MADIDIKEMFVSPEASIKEAFKRMDAAGKKIVFVVDPKDKLLGVVTDGDIRRWILKGQSLDDRIYVITNRKPRMLKKGFKIEDAREAMLSLEINSIPVVDEDQRMVSAVWWTDLFEKRKKGKALQDTAVVIMAGGEGTRLSPFTHVFPKPLIPIGDKPLIELIIDRFVESGCSDFYLSVNYKANILKAYFSELEHGYKLNYIQEEQPLGTAGSLYMLRDKIKKPFFVSNCDILVDADYPEILNFHTENSNSITLVVSMKHYKIPYGICRIENGGSLKEIAEKPEYDFLVNTGMYLLEPSTLRDIPEGKRYDITDLINDYLKNGKKVGVYPVSDKSWLDMGQWQQLQEAIRKFETK